MKKPSIALGFLVLLAGTVRPSAEGSAPSPARGEIALKIVVSSVFVDDQEKALAFYTEKLGFLEKTNVPVGKFRWLTVVSPEAPDGVELLLEPNENPAAKAFQEAVFAQGIPVTSFGVDDIQATYDALQRRGVVFRMPPTKAGPVTVAVFEDTCGNLIQIAQK